MDERFAELTPAFGVVLDGPVSSGAGVLCQTKFEGVELRQTHCLAEIPLDAGRWILCQMRIKEQLGLHPLADLILWNALQ